MEEFANLIFNYGGTVVLAALFIYIFIMKDKIAKLINVKSLVTLVLTLVVAYKAIMGQMDIEQIYLMIIAFYFGTQLKENKTE